MADAHLLDPFDPSPYYPALALIRIPSDPHASSKHPDPKDPFGTGFFVTNNGLLLTVAHNLTEEVDPKSAPLPWVWVCCYDQPTKDWTELHRVPVDASLLDPDLDAAALRVPVNVSVPLPLCAAWRRGDNVVVLGFQPEKSRRRGYKYNLRSLRCIVTPDHDVAPLDLTGTDEPCLRLNIRYEISQPPLGRGISGGPVLNIDIPGKPAVAIEKAEEYPDLSELRPPEVKSTAVRWFKKTLDTLDKNQQMEVEWLPCRRYNDPLRESYLNSLFEKCANLPLEGIDPRAKSDVGGKKVSLDAVYTALMTLTPEEKDSTSEMERVRGHEVLRLSALEQLERHTRLVLLGEPGGGKTTFIKFVAMCMAGEALGHAQANLKLLTEPLPDDKGKDREERQSWIHGPLLPVLVTLRDLAARGLPPAGQQANADHLLQFIENELGEALKAYAPGLVGELRESGGLILLDGLDEVPEAKQRRRQIKQAVEDFASKFVRCRFLVTCRTYAYQQEKWQLASFQHAFLADFTPGQIIRFVDRWYAHIGPLRALSGDSARGQAKLLKDVVTRNERLYTLAKRPLLLTLMASLHAWRKGSLPEKREELYAEVVELLLDWWEQAKVIRDDQGNIVVAQPSLLEWLKADRDQVRDLVNRLAFVAHERQPDLVGTADIPEDDLIKGLWSLSKSPKVDPTLLEEYLSTRAGLTLPRKEGAYAFPHRTIQEYLAACHLTKDGYPDKLAELVRKEPERWREVTLLAGAKAARGAPYAMWALADALCYSDPSVANEGVEDVWGGHVAGLLLADSADLAHVGKKDSISLDRVRKWLVRILEGGLLPAIERAAAGNSLARLGDPRFHDQTAFCLPNDPRLGFVEVPAGPFIMGRDKTRDQDAPAGETPQHTVELPRFYIARYPVTVDQFKAFVDESKYPPRDTDSLKGEAIHPVVNVTWYDAMKYCEWLTEKLRSWGQTPEPLATLLREGKSGGNPWRITLPSEAEWEKAARGEDGRIYPWGNEPDSNRANYDETGIGTTSSVGCFPGGKSPYRCLDMAGNVFEWTRSLWGKEYEKPDFQYPYKPGDGRENLEAGCEIRRVLRGGSFGGGRRSVRCAHRGGGGPGRPGRVLRVSGGAFPIFVFGLWTSGL